MIKFFRKIRYDLMEMGRTGKYLKYAIGEIILVVIGILIALSINNWNQKRLDLIEGKNYLTSIKEDLNEQLAIFDIQMDYEVSIINSGKPILEEYESNSTLTFNPEFTSNLSHLANRKTFNRIDPTYTDLLSSGNLDLIKNEKIKKALIKYYEELERVEKVILSNNNVIDAIIPVLMKVTYLNRNYFNPRDREKVQTKSGVEEGLVFYSGRLLDISKSRWNDEKVELELMNVILFRTEMATHHYITAERMKDETTVLIKLISELDR